MLSFSSSNASQFLIPSPVELCPGGRDSHIKREGMFEKLRRKLQTSVFDLSSVHSLIELCSIYQGTMSPELRHKERNNVLSQETMNDGTLLGISYIIPLVALTLSGVGHKSILTESVTIEL